MPLQTKPPMSPAKTAPLYQNQSLERERDLQVGRQLCKIILPWGWRKGAHLPAKDRSLKFEQNQGPLVREKEGLAVG